MWRREDPSRVQECGEEFCRILSGVWWEVSPSREDAACCVPLCILVSQFGFYWLQIRRRLNDGGCMGKEVGRRGLKRGAAES